MQKRPSAYTLQYLPIAWERDFPIAGSRHLQRDEEITRLHRHNGLELGYCFAGSGIFVVESKVFTYRAGDTVVINDREMHLAQSTPGSTSDWGFAFLDPAGLTGPLSHDANLVSIRELGGPAFPNILSESEHPRLGMLIRCLLEETARRSTGHRLAIRGLVQTIMAMLHRLPGRDFTQGQAPSGLHRIAPALQHMAANLAEDLRIPALAERCHLSLTHFRRLFREHTGCSPLRYLITLRLNMAKALLRGTDESVHRVSLRVGYATLSSFNRHFKREVGCSPREYRRACTSKPAGDIEGSGSGQCGAGDDEYET